MESNNSQASGSSPTFLLILGFIAGGLLVGSAAVIATTAGWLRPGESDSAPTVVQNVTVSYMYETDPGSASGNNDLPVESIQFHPGYVVVTRSSGDSSLFAVDRLRNFQFSPTRSD